jgi:hypothetical protein
MRWLCLLWFGFSALIFAQELTKQDMLLARARYHMGQTLNRMPNYTCTQTIERVERRAPSKRIQMVDMLRLEVALVNGRELYKWPGSGSFKEVDLRDMIPTGAVGTGQFAGYAQSVFLAGVARYTYMGEESRNGRLQSRWDYVVPQNLSGFNLKVGDREAIVGFHGSFWIDSETVDLKRLEVFADDIPPHLELRDAITRVEYERSHIGTGDFLLPSMSEMELVDLRGGASINRARFAGCRQYTGQSTISFDDPEEEKPSAVPLRTVSAPAGVTLDSILETKITDKASAIGDSVTVVLAKDAKLGREVIAPKGAVGHGRITFLRKQDMNRYTGYMVGLELTHFEFGNTHLRVAATLENVPGVSMGPGARAGAAMQVLRQASPTTYLPAGEHLPGNVLFRQGYSLVLDRGTRMYWRTVKVESGDSE